MIKTNATRTALHSSPIPPLLPFPTLFPRALLLQKALNSEGATPESIAKVVREIAGASGLSEDDIDRLVDQGRGCKKEYWQMAFFTI